MGQYRLDWAPDATTIQIVGADLSIAQPSKENALTRANVGDSHLMHTRINAEDAIRNLEEA